MTDDLVVRLQRHQELINTSDRNLVVCSFCYQEWPCDGKVFADEIERLRDESAGVYEKATTAQRATLGLNEGETDEWDIKMEQLIAEIRALREKLPRAIKAHNGEVCVDVQEHCEKLTAENCALRKKLEIAENRTMLAEEGESRAHRESHVLREKLEKAGAWLGHFIREVNLDGQGVAMDHLTELDDCLGEALRALDEKEPDDDQ
jgi:hypothetical protein